MFKFSKKKLLKLVCFLILLITFLLSFALIKRKVFQVKAQEPGPGWLLTFNDEFDGPTLDRTKWDSKYVWGVRNLNEELQVYIDEAHQFENGVLKLVAKEESVWPGLPYTSGMVSSHVSFEQQYGYFEIRCKMPNHNGGEEGFWPAFWMTSESWPPEIDILEWLSWDPNGVHMTTHYGTQSTHQQRGYYWSGPDFADDFHTFAVKWTPEELIWYVDGIERARHTDAPGVPHTPMHIIANLAIGDWGGTPTAATIFPNYFEIDYIRAYEYVEGGHPLSLSQGWNEIVWPGVSGKKASDVPPKCPMAISQENFWFRPYVRNYGGVNFDFEGGRTYYLKCNQDFIWNLTL